MFELFDAINQHLWLTITVAVVFSLLIGSFLNVVIYRLPLMLKLSWKAEVDAINHDPDAFKDLPSEQPFNLSQPRSRCKSCKAQVRWYDNVPLFGYLALGGKCRDCKTAISLRYPIVELTSGLLIGYCAYAYGFTLITLALAVFTWVLICLTLIDYDHQLLPDNLTLPLLWLGLGVNSFGYFATLEQAVYGAIFGYLALWSVYWCFKLLTGKEGMGYGDFKLLAALGAWCGVSLLPVIILLSSVVGAVVGITLVVLKKQDQSKPIPFGPYLAVAGWITLLFGENLVGAYLRLFVF